MTSLHVRGEDRDAFDIVGAVEEDEGPAADRLEPQALPAGLPDGRDRILALSEGPPDPREDLRGGDGHRRVPALVAAGEAGREGVAPVLPRVDEAISAADPSGLERPPGAEDLGQRRFSLARDAADLAQGRPASDSANDRDGRLDDRWPTCDWF